MGELKTRSRTEIRTTNPELYFAVVAPVGVDSNGVCERLKEALETVGYEAHVIHLIKEVHDFDLGPWQNHPEANFYERYQSHMSVGNHVREQARSNDAFALLAATQVLRWRIDRARKDQALPDLSSIVAEKGSGTRRAFIFRSFKRPEEVTTLRDIYGEDGVWIIAAHASREDRISRLSQEIANTDFAKRPTDYRPDAERLVRRDEEEVDDPHGQRLKDTFARADISLDASQPAKVRESLKRFVDLLFDRSVITPSPDEYMMFHSQAGALRSSSLSRQVGATIATGDGQVVAVGTNEVPRAGGGLYWEGNEPDVRDHTLGFDLAEETKVRGLGQILNVLADAPGWLTEDKKRKFREDSGSREKLVQQVWNLTRSTELMGVVEFGRTVHAEMSALMDAAQRGVSVQDGTLYTTTFPCHVCARHIVAAGIQRVVYRDPYPKSLATDLHFDTIQMEPSSLTHDQVAFEPFIGVAPRRYIDLFTMGQRTSNGKPLAKPFKANPRLQGLPVVSCVVNEMSAAGVLLRGAAKASELEEPEWLRDLADLRASF